VGVERHSHQNQFGRAEIADPGRNGATRSKLRNQGKIHKRRLEFRALAAYTKSQCVNIVVHSDRCPLNRAMIGLSKSINALIKRACGLSPSLEGFFKKSSTSLPAQNESSRAVPEHDANLIILRSGIENVRQRDVHRRRHRVFLCRPVQLNPQDASEPFANNVAHI